MIMLTLSWANMVEVMASVDPDAFSVFLQEYLQAAASQDCEVRPVCGRCLAVAYGYGLEIFRDIDLCCWKEDRKTRVHYK